MLCAPDIEAPSAGDERQRPFTVYHIPCAIYRCFTDIIFVPYTVAALSRVTVRESAAAARVRRSFRIFYNDFRYGDTSTTLSSFDHPSFFPFFENCSLSFSLYLTGEETKRSVTILIKILKINSLDRPIRAFLRDVSIIVEVQ